VPFQRNPRKLRHRHAIAISCEEWEFAREIGRMQESPVSPHGVLLTVIRKFLTAKAAEMRSAQAQAYDGAAPRRRSPMVVPY